MNRVGHLFERFFDLAVEGEGEAVLSRVGMLERTPEELLQAEAPATDGRHHRNAELPRQLLGIDLDTVAGCLIHHVEGDDHRSLELEKLHGQLERPAEAAGVNDVDDEIVGFFEKVSLGLPGVLFRRGQRVDPRQIHNLHLVPMDQRLADGEGDRRIQLAEY